MSRFVNRAARPALAVITAISLGASVQAFAGSTAGKFLCADCEENPDGVVNVNDLLNQLAQWGGAGGCDLNQTGTVDINDLLELLGQWGQECGGGGPGACCIDIDECQVLAEEDCIKAGGAYNGDDTMCEPDICLTPPNDDCAGSIDIFEDVDGVGTPVNLGTATSSDPDPFCTLDGEDLWYTYTASGAGLVRILSDDLDVFIEVYESHACPPGTLVDCAPLEFGVVIPFIEEGDQFTIRLINDDVDVDGDVHITLEQMGACCFDSKTCQDDVDSSDCLAQGGTFQGVGVNCADIACVVGACCLPTGACQDNQTSAGCEAADGVYQGDGSLCADVDCAITGACCLFDTGLGQLCEDVTETECIKDLGGQYEGDGTLCADITCVPRGACCLSPIAEGEETCEDNLTQEDCEKSGGVYQGNLTDCADVNCTLVGACCAPASPASGGGTVCIEGETESDCVNVFGGVYQGDGSVCDNVDCSVGACCVPEIGLGDGNFFCIGALSEIECTKIEGGIYQGDGTLCADINCNVTTGACCVNDKGPACLEDQTQEQCVNAGGVYAGDFTTCVDIDCTVGACCTADGGCTDGLTQAGCAQIAGIFQGFGSTCAASLCNCGNPKSGSCFEIGVPFCDDTDCCLLVCELDPFCCETEWDDICVEEAFGNCANPPSGACCQNNGSCTIETPITCDSIDGTYLGDDTVCDDCPA